MAISAVNLLSWSEPHALHVTVGWFSLKTDHREPVNVPVRSQGDALTSGWGHELAA